MIISPNEFANIFGPLTPFVTEKVKKYEFAHAPLSHEALEVALIELIEEIREQDLPRSGPARHPIWETGWAENLAAFDPTNAGPDLARPRYFNKHPIVRWNKQLFRAVSTDYEYNMLATIQHWLFEKYFSNLGIVYEFGCGTGHNLFRVREVNKVARLVGLDWAESAVKFINLQADHGADNNMEARRFNFFEPDDDFHMAPGSARSANSSGVYTVAALEQVGKNFGPFLDYLLAQKPGIVAHVEPFGEMLNPSRLIDWLSLEYFERRNYLSGYLTRLRQLDRQGKIDIIEERRTYIGSKFVEGYNIVVWAAA